MNEQGFVSRRESDWNRLDALINQAEDRPSRLTAQDAREFLRLYRLAATDLSTIRAKSTNPALTDSLNDLVGRAYGVLYRAPRRPFLLAVYNSLAIMAQTVRRRKLFVFASLGIFLVSGFGSYWLMGVVPDMQHLFIPAMLKDTVDGWKRGEMPDRDATQSFAMWGMYASHNPLVAIISGAVGAGTFGILSTYLIIQNGTVLGALSHEMSSVGKLGFLLARITPHGVTEMSGLIMSGAAGLMLGWALINPGRRTRGDALREAGPDAITLLGISIVQTFMAAPVEGWFSFNDAIPVWMKLAFAGSSLVAWICFWVYFARDKAANPLTTGS